MSEICKFLTNAVTCIVSGTEIRIIGFVVLLLDLQNIDNFITVRPFSTSQYTKQNCMIFNQNLVRTTSNKTMIIFVLFNRGII